MCPSLISENISHENCIGSCICSDGYFRNSKNECVKLEKCPCLHNDELVAANDEVHFHGETCTCMDGKLNCMVITKFNYTCPLLEMKLR
jgi:mucin-2